MNTVSIVAHSRPLYTRQVISGLIGALAKLPERFFDLLIFSIDPGYPEVLDVCESGAKVLAKSDLIDCEVVVNAPSRFGAPIDAIAANVGGALHRAFETHDSSFHVSLEDDAVLTPDSLLLARWFHEAHGGPLSDYSLFSFCNHRDYGRGQQPEIPESDPSLVAESARITSPFAWSLTRWQWPMVAESWNSKICFPRGWDYSLSLAMRLNRQRALHPVLSRCRNVGREGGTNETASSYDETQGNLIYSDGSYAGPYRVAVRIPDPELEQLDDWMVAEVNGMTEAAKT